MNEPVQLSKRLHRENEYYDEEVYLSDLSSQVSAPNLDIFCFGSSLFRAGAILPICTSNWVIQYQTGGRADIVSEEENYQLRPGDLLVVPPHVPYSYRVPDKNDMRKYFMILRSGPIPDLMLGREIRQHGMKVTPDDPEFYCGLILKIGTLFASATMETQEEISCLLYKLFLNIRNTILKRTPQGAFYRNLCKAATDLQNRQITLEALSRSFGMNKYSLIREFHRKTGETPVAYMISLRIKYAEQLLRLSNMNIAEISVCCGYSTPSFFISDFKKHIGMTPGQYRNCAQTNSRI